MGKRASLTTQEYLVTAALPEATETYTVIPHGSVIDKTKTALQNKGFEIERELYRCNQGAQIAQGVYHLKYGDDPDMSMLFAWSNSYDKSMKFKCCIGGYVHSSLSTILGAASMGSWNRKHTGDADNEAFDMIDAQIEEAEDFFKQLVADKEVMKMIPITEQVRGELMGRIYFVHELLTSEQLSTVRNQFNKPSFTCSGVENSVWAMYNAIILSLQQAHPKTWMDQQRMIHWFLCDHFKISAGVLGLVQENSVTIEEPVVDPNQLNIIDEIEKTEEDMKMNTNFDNEGPEPSPVREGAIVLHIAPEAVDSSQGGAPFVGMQEPIKTEAELSQELYGVNNDNAEATLSTAMRVETESEVEDNSWPCLECGEFQGPEDLFNEGQLCTKCVNKTV
jgi:hypothetical protein